MEEIKKDWRDIFRAFRMAFDPKKLLLGFGGVIVTIVSFTIITTIFNRLGIISLTSKVFINDVFFSSKLCPYEMLLSFCQSMAAFGVGKLIASAVFLLTLLVIWSVVGGAITRISALEYAKDESIRISEAVKFSFKKFWSFFSSPIVPAIGVVFFALCNVLGGLLGKLGVLGDIFIAFGFPLALLSSLMITFIGVIGFVGLCLMFPTISAEGSDAFDAMSRAYSYVLSKPRKYISYFLISSFYGIVCISFVALAACFIVYITFDTVGIGMGQKFKDIVDAVKLHPGYCTLIGASANDFKNGLSTLSSKPEKLVALSILVSLVTIKTLVIGFALSYLGSVKTIIYFLMRKEVDDIDVTDIYIEGENVEQIEETDIPGNEKFANGKKDDSGGDKENN